MSECGLEVSAEKAKNMYMSWEQNAGQNNNIKIGNKSSEGGTVQISGNNPDKAKFHLQRT